MNMLRLIPLLGVLLLAGNGAIAQMSLTPPGVQPPATDKPKPLERPAEKPKAAEKPAEKPPTPAAAKKPVPAPAAVGKPAGPPLARPPATTTAALPPSTDPNADLVYGAYQRGQYKTALDLATARAQAGDPKAMTMLGQLYENAMGIRRDFDKAAGWYKR